MTFSEFIKLCYLHHNLKHCFRMFQSLKVPLSLLAVSTSNTPLPTTDLLSVFVSDVERYVSIQT